MGCPAWPIRRTIWLVWQRCSGDDECGHVPFTHVPRALLQFATMAESSKQNACASKMVTQEQFRHKAMHCGVSLLHARGRVHG